MLYTHSRNIRKYYAEYKINCHKSIVSGHATHFHVCVHSRYSKLSIFLMLNKQSKSKWELNGFERFLIVPAVDDSWFVWLQLIIYSDFVHLYYFIIVVRFAILMVFPSCLLHCTVHRAIWFLWEKKMHSPCWVVSTHCSQLKVDKNSKAKIAFVSIWESPSAFWAAWHCGIGLTFAYGVLFSF